MAAPCRARHTSVLVAAHVAIRHLTTSDGIRSTADTITAAPDTTTGRTSSRPDIPHGMPSAFKLPTATRPATVEAAPDTTTTRTRPADFRTRPRFAVLRHDTTETKNARHDGTAAHCQRSKFHTATAHNGPIRPRFAPTTATTSTDRIAAHTAQKKPPHGHFRWGCFLLRGLFHNQVGVSRRFYYQALGRLIRGREEACISADDTVRIPECVADRTKNHVFRADFCRGCVLVILFYAAACCVSVGGNKTLPFLGGCFYSFHFFICFGCWFLVLSGANLRQNFVIHKHFQTFIAFYTKFSTENTHFVNSDFAN